MAFPPGFMRADSARRIQAMPIERRLRLLRGASGEFMGVYTAIERGDGLPTRDPADFFAFVASSRVLVYDASHVNSEDPSCALSDFASAVARSHGMEEEGSQAPVDRPAPQEPSQSPSPDNDPMMTKEDDPFEFTLEALEADGERDDSSDGLLDHRTSTAGSSWPTSFLALLSGETDIEPDAASNKAHTCPPSHDPLEDAVENVGPRRRLCSVADCKSTATSRGHCNRHDRMCKIENCTRRAHTGQLCRGHQPCKVPGCQRACRARGFCGHHGGVDRCSTPGCNFFVRSGGKCRGHSSTTVDVRQSSQ